MRLAMRRLRERVLPITVVCCAAMLVAGGTCGDPSGGKAANLKFPLEFELKAVLINSDPEWDVVLWSGDGPAPSGPVLKPGESRRETVRLHFDRSFEIMRVKFSAQAHGQTVADQTLQVRPWDASTIGVVFERDGDGNPAVHWLEAAGR